MDQVLVVSYHVREELIEEVRRKGFIYNRYKIESTDSAGNKSSQGALSMSFLVNAAGVDLSVMGIDPALTASLLGLPEQSKWSWHCDVCAEDALPAGTYWVGDIHSVACKELRDQIPDHQTVLSESIDGVVLRDIDQFPGLFYAVLPCIKSENAYVDSEDGRVYRTKSGCIGVIPKVLVENIEVAREIGDFINCPLQLPVRFDKQSGSMDFDNITMLPYDGESSESTNFI